MVESGIFEKKKDALVKRVLDFYEDVRYKYLSAKDDPKKYGKEWHKAVERIRDDFDGLSNFSNEMKKFVQEDIVFHDSVKDPESVQAKQLYDQVKDMRFNSDELNDPLA